MAQGKLSRSDKTQLEEWIGSGRKEFTLLYSATRDGCSSTVFHQKCDNQGPTVTVLYNPHDTVYGGYAGVSWKSEANGVYVNSASEFMFRLYYNGSLKAMKFPFKCDRDDAIHLIKTSGPYFGNDLLTFRDTINMSGGIFELNGSMNIGNSYDVQGLTTNDINNDTMHVTELEVYKVTAQQLRTCDRAPWRKVEDWSVKTLYSLKEEIRSFRPVEGVGVTRARLVMIGPIGAGKSSFINSVDSVFTGSITQKACSGSAGQSVSTMYTPYQIHGTRSFRLCDTPGLEETKEMYSVQFNYLLEGNMPNYYVFNSNAALKPDTPGFKIAPTFDDKVHCVIFVLDSVTLEALSSEFLEKIKQFKLFLYQKGIPHMVLLTKVDDVCKDVKEDVTNIYKSVVVREYVDKAAQLLGIPPLHIYPIKNYVTEDECDVNVGIVVLKALRHALNSANSYLQVVADRAADESETQEI